MVVPKRLFFTLLISAGWYLATINLSLTNFKSTVVREGHMPKHDDVAIVNMSDHKWDYIRDIEEDNYDSKDTDQETIDLLLDTNTNYDTESSHVDISSRNMDNVTERVDMGQTEKEDGDYSKGNVSMNYINADDIEDNNDSKDTDPKTIDTILDSNTDFHMESSDANTNSSNIDDVTELATTRKTETDNSDGSAKKNVILLLADDMRPQIGAYLGEDHPTPFNPIRTVTPNFDRLAAESIVFTRAYVQYSLCGPSRTSLLTSRRPDTTRVFGNEHYWRTAGGNFTTIPQYFKDQGYVSIGAGKVFHPSRSSNNSDPISWSENFFSRYYDGMYEHESRLPGWNAITDEERTDVPLTDEFALRHVLERLQFHAKKARTGQLPIFLSLGFRKPHISLNCPKKYFKLYPLENADNYLSNKTWQSPEVGFRLVNSTMRNGKHQIPDGELRRLRRAYFACISYVDSLLGELLDEVDRLGLASSTIIVFMADHGYHLGENNHWGKYMASEMANHVPMMIKIPGKTQHGIRTRSIVEAVDLFPTLVEAANVDMIPQCPTGSSFTELCTDGISLMPLIRKPMKVLKDSALSQVLRGHRYMEYTLRTDKFRYTAFAGIIHHEHENGTYTVHMEWDPPGTYRQLFDHSVDPEERYNMATEQNYETIVVDLHDKLLSKVDTIYNVPVKLPSTS